MKKKPSRLLARVSIACIWLIGKSPSWLRIFLSHCLGILSYLLSRRHRHIARTNLSLCFPEMKQREKELFIYKNFQQLSLGICETAYAWCGNIEKSKIKIHWQGKDRLVEFLRQKRKVLLISGHFSCLDSGLILFSRHFPLVASYKVHANPLFNRFAYRQRSKHLAGLISSKDTMAIRKILKHQAIFWLSIDQDIGKKHSLWTDFFATQAASHNIAWRWSKIMKAEVLLLHIVREKNSSYKITLTHLPNFAEMKMKDAIGYQNQVLTQAIQTAPTQYLWLHKKFKTQLEGKNVYQQTG